MRPFQCKHALFGFANELNYATLLSNWLRPLDWFCPKGTKRKEDVRDKGRPADLTPPLLKMFELRGSLATQNLNPEQLNQEVKEKKKGRRATPKQSVQAPPVLLAAAAAANAWPGRAWRVPPD